MGNTREINNIGGASGEVLAAVGSAVTNSTSPAASRGRDGSEKAASTGAWGARAENSRHSAGLNSGPLSNERTAGRASNALYPARNNMSL